MNPFFFSDTIHLLPVNRVAGTGNNGFKPVVANKTALSEAVWRNSTSAFAATFNPEDVDSINGGAP
ncbi:MAG: hypothetical protein Q9P14_08995 [candidate division KSB1 bacterium]|nr:hypothetical protein [candidate division KSB1 bacterium]